MTMHSPSGSPNSPRAEINVTPLVDVVLVLLIIFMVVTPLLQTGRPVPLPAAKSPLAKPERRGQVLVVVERDGRTYIGDDELDPARFRARMTESWQRAPDAPVLVKADRNLTFGDVKRVLLDVRDAGYRDTGLVARKEDR